MIGPGWMPSRPRPLAQRVRRRIARCAPYLKRQARRITRRDPGDDAPAVALETPGPFANQRAKLPVATLVSHGAMLPGARRSRGVLTSGLQRWLRARWLWVQPRMIPLIVAFMGLVGVLNARRYLLSLARGGEPPPVTCTAGPLGCAATPDLPHAIHER